MSKNVSELCTLLVEEIYGSLPCKIIHTLLQHGRLSRELIQRNTGLLLNDVKATLAVLIQHNLVLYSIPSNTDGVCYEAHVANIYNLVRFGKFVRLAESRFGKIAGSIVSTLQGLGHSDINSTLSLMEHIEKGPSMESGPPNDRNLKFVNGLGKTSEDNNSLRLTDRSSDAVKKLLHSGIIEPLCDRKQLMSVADLRNEADSALKNKGEKPSVLGGKAKVEYNERILIHMKNWRMKYSQYKANDADYKSQESEGYGDENPPKRRKINGGTSRKANGVHSRHIVHDSDEGEDDSQRIDRNMTVRVSRDKCNIVLRSEQLVIASARTLGESTSKVYEALLRCIEDRTERCYDEYEDHDGRTQNNVSPSIKASQVEAAMSPSIDLRTTLGPSSKFESIEIEGDGPGPPVNGIKKLDSESHQRRRLVEQHLRLLAEHQDAYVTCLPSPEPLIPTTWQVNFPSLIRTLIQQSLEDIITSRFGLHAKRLVRVLHTQGKLDERRLAQVAFMRQKDLRAVLTAMQEAGFVDTQEVPKDSSRQPRSTIYLWFYDQERCRQLVLEDTYKAMARLLQRAKVEKDKLKSVLEKAARTDVKGQEDIYLSTPEMEALADWQRREEVLLVQLGRQDDLVALLKDFLPSVLP